VDVGGLIPLIEPERFALAFRVARKLESARWQSVHGALRAQAAGGRKHWPRAPRPLASPISMPQDLASQMRIGHDVWGCAAGRLMKQFRLKRQMRSLP